MQMCESANVERIKCKCEKCENMVQMCIKCESANMKTGLREDHEILHAYRGELVARTCRAWVTELFVPKTIRFQERIV